MTRTVSLRLTAEEATVLHWIGTQQPHLSWSDLVRDMVLREGKRRGIAPGLIAEAVESRKQHAPRARRVPFYKLPHRE